MWIFFVFVFCEALFGNVLVLKIAKSQNANLDISLVYFFAVLIFLKPNFETYDFWTLVWVVGITDTVIKFITIAAKCAVAIVPRSCLSFKRRVSMAL